jgi:hypothetical protein
VEVVVSYADVLSRNMDTRTEETHEEIRTPSEQPFKISYQEVPVHRNFLELQNVNFFIRNARYSVSESSLHSYILMESAFHFEKCLLTYEGVSIISGTDAAICTAVVARRCKERSYH